MTYLENHSSEITPRAFDINEPDNPERIDQEIHRIVRDTKISREVKLHNNYKCQNCGFTIKFSDGKLYAESHHIKPLGSSHNGPDMKENIICVCPNHHAMLDYGAVKLESSSLKSGHKISEDFIDYHNNYIYRGEL